MQDKYFLEKHSIVPKENYRHLEAVHFQSFSSLLLSSVTNVFLLVH
jgi:hypothetical protein